MINISVIIPVYKVPLEYLRKCFDSLIAQTTQECEFIVVSDGAPEEECSICEEYASKDSRFKFFRREHAGVSATRNYGINQAKGEYITFVDSDDRITKNFCETIFKKAKEWNSDILLFEHISDKRKKLLSHSLYNQDLPKVSIDQYRDLVAKLYLPNSIEGLILVGICCKAYRLTFIRNNNLKFETSLHYSEDQLFCLNAFLKTQNVSYLARSPFYIQNCRPTSSSHVYKADYESEVYFYFEKIDLIARNNPNLIHKNLFFDRVIQCILYTLDICIFRPDSKISLKKRKSAFIAFISKKYCKESLLCSNKSMFSTPEKIACYLCQKKMFGILWLISKKWHIQRAIEQYRNH